MQINFTGETMSKRFTEKAENALNTSVKIAEKLGHTYIGTEHILLSILSDTQSCASFILGKHLLNYDKFYKTVVEYSGTGVKSTLSIMDISPRGREVMERSFANAVTYGDGVIGTDHILLSVLTEKNSVAVRLLTQSGIDVAQMKNDVLSLLKNKEKRNSGIKKEIGSPLLKQYGKDLTQMARNGEFDPVIGRDRETERMIRILCRKNKNNPCLIGEAGVGKTAIVEGLAERIVSGKVPDFLKDKALISLDLTSIIAGAKYRGDFEERIKGLLGEVAANRSIILFIDEIHTIVGAGAAEGAVDAANILKPQLSRGDIQIIGATTFKEYHRYIERDAALERRFQPIIVEEPTAERSISMLMGIKERYEDHHNVSIDRDAIVKCVELSERYINDRFLPDKAIDLLDEACAYVSAGNDMSKNRVSALICGQNNVRREATADRNAFRQAIVSEYNDDLSSIFNKVDRPCVQADDVINIASEIYDIPRVELKKDKYRCMAESLNKKVVGQNNAVDKLVRAIKKCDAGLNRSDRPRGIFMLCGGSGTGKTTLSCALASELFHSKSSFIRIDMSEYSERHTVSRLIGAPPGYVGSGEGGMLTEYIRRNPYSLVLLDEFDKAHSEVKNIFLQVFDYGYLTDADGRRVSFTNTYIIMTTNCEGYSSRVSVGFQQKEKESDDYSLLRSRYSGELMGRIDEVIFMRDLDRNDFRLIAKYELSMLADRVSQRGISLFIEEEVIDYIVSSGRPKEGARSVKKAISSEIEGIIADALAEIKDGEKTITLSLGANGVTAVVKEEKKNVRETSDV